MGYYNDQTLSRTNEDEQLDRLDGITPAPRSPHMMRVQWRSGGSLRFTWHECDAMPAAQAVELRGEIARMGYAARVVPAGTPLPTTFDV